MHCKRNCRCLKFLIFILYSIVTPSIIPFSYDEIVNVGDAFNLFCQISKGDKPIVIKWSFRGFDDSRGIQIITNRISDKSSLLSISNATASHSGTYTCTATNNAGSSSYSTNITVNGKDNGGLNANKKKISIKSKFEVATTTK